MPDKWFLREILKYNVWIMQNLIVNWKTSWKEKKYKKDRRGRGGGNKFPLAYFHIQTLRRQISTQQAKTYVWYLNHFSKDKHIGINNNTNTQ